MVHAFFIIFLSFFLAIAVPIPTYADLVETPSNASETGPKPEDLFFDLPEDPQSPVLDSVIAFTDSSEDYAASADSFVNVLRFDVTISDVEYILLFSPDYRDDLMVDSTGNLWNVSASQITGRAFSGDFDPYADTGTLIYLAPCLGNNFSTNHNYNSPNWLRRYYWSSSDRLTYTDTYVRIQVEKSYHGFYVSETNSYILMFLIGGCLLCLWKKSVR